MGGSLIKNIVLSVVLIILAFFLGVSVADDAKGAGAIFICFTGVVALIALGKRIWMAIFLLPPLCAFYPTIINFSTTQLLYVAIFMYWLIMWGLGHVKLTWRKLLSLDILVFLFVGYIAIQFVQNPVSVSFLEVFGIETDRIGGKEYYTGVVAFISYLGLSVIPFPKDKLLKVLKWALVITVLLAVVRACSSAVIGSSRYDSMMEEGMKSRFSYFAEVGMMITILVYGCVPFSRIVFSIKYLFLMAVGFVFVLISGWRTHFIIYGAAGIACALIKREMIIMVVCVLIAYCGIFYLGLRGSLHHLPYGVQRTLSLVPGIQVDRSIARSAKASSDWRVEMWKQALDPRTGQIIDYVWGDGMFRSKGMIERYMRAIARREAVMADQQAFMTTKQWHGGFVTNISAIGIVGSSILGLLQLWTMFLVIRVCRALRGSDYYKYALFQTVGLFSGVFFYYISTGMVGLALDTLPTMALLKMYYNIAIEEGRLQPWSWRKRYVPMLLQEQELTAAKN